MIPVEIINIAAEATSEHNDGWAKELCRKQLEQIRNYIDNVLSCHGVPPVIIDEALASPSNTRSTGGKL